MSPLVIKFQGGKNEFVYIFFDTLYLCPSYKFWHFICFFDLSDNLNITPGANAVWKYNAIYDTNVP